MDARLTRWFEYNGWANSRILECLRGVYGLDDRVCRLFAHLVATERVWLYRIRGAPNPPGVHPDWSLAECAGWCAENHKLLTAYLAEADAAELARVIRFRKGGTEYRYPVADILAHVLSHGAYHRGQIAAAVRQRGVKTPATDFIIFARPD